MTEFWGTPTKHDGPSALEKMIVQRLLACLKADLTALFHESPRQMTPAALKNWIRLAEKAARTLVAKLPADQITRLGGPVVRYKCRQIKTASGWRWAFKLLTTAKTVHATCTTRTKREGIRWAKAIIASGTVNYKINIAPVDVARRIVVPSLSERRSTARKVGDFYEVDGFIVYEQYVETCPHTHEPDLARRELLETEVEQEAIDFVAARNTSDVYYEKGRILV